MRPALADPVPAAGSANPLRDGPRATPAVADATSTAPSAPAEVAPASQGRRTSTVDSPPSQTLDRGLRILEHIAASSRPLTTAEVAHDVGLHRSITYRMLRTLEAHRLATRDAEGAWLPGSGLAVLASSVHADLRLAAQSVLETLANETAMTAFLVIRDHDEAVTALVVEPRTAIAHVIYRPGRRHPVTCGAPGIALLSGEPPTPDERPEVGLCRARGWSFSDSEVLPGMKACAAPVVGADGTCTAAVSVVFVGEPDLDALAAHVVHAAAQVGTRSEFIAGARG